MSDSARKRKLADFVVTWKKQFVVQKCMVCGRLASFSERLLTCVD
jgi:hypothetical protein